MEESGEEGEGWKRWRRKKVQARMEGESCFASGLKKK